MKKQIQEQAEQIQSFKEEIRKVKTLSHYYPENRDLIIEEGDGMKDSSEGEYEEEGPKRNEVLIASSSDLFTKDRNEAEIMALRGSYDRYSSDRDSALRKSENGFNYSVDNISHVRVSSQGQSPREEKPIVMKSIEFEVKGKNADLLRSSSNGFDPLRASAPVNALRESHIGDKFNTTQVNLRSSVRSEKSYKFDIIEGCDDEVKEIPPLFENFIKFLADKKDEETLRFAEFTFSKVENIFKNQQMKLKDSRTKNFSLISIISDLKQKEKLNMIKFMQEGNLRNTVINPLDSHREHNSSGFGGSLMVPSKTEDWEYFDMGGSDANIRNNNTKINIPDNLQKFDAEKTRIELLKNIHSSGGEDPVNIQDQKFIIAPEKNSLINKMSERRQKILDHMTAQKSLH